MGEWGSLHLPQLLTYLQLPSHSPAADSFGRAEQLSHRELTRSAPPWGLRCPAIQNLPPVIQHSKLGHSPSPFKYQTNESVQWLLCVLNGNHDPQSMYCSGEL